MIKKYNQFIKEKTNEEIGFDREMPTMEPETKPDVRPQTNPRPVAPSIIPDKGNAPLESPDKAQIEEEGGDIYASKLKELSDYLGAEVENNKINYKGNEITFPSETEKYQIKGVKKGFDTIEEVVSELEKHEQKSDNLMKFDEDNYEKGDLAFESKSYKNTRTRNLKKK